MTAGRGDGGLALAGRPIGWGILGAGQVARSFARGLQSLPDATLVAVASRTRATAERFARDLAPRRVHATFEDVVRDPEVDVVYVATPHHRHAHDCLLALEHGKPVLCEKPFTLDADEARRVVAMARERGLFCMEAMWMRCFPLLRRVRAMVEDGLVGDVRMVTADFGVPTPFDPTSRFFDPAQGGGALLDRGIYPLSLASLLLGPPTTIASGAAIGPTGVDDQSAVVLGYAGGQLAVLSSSLRAFTPNEARIVGTRGAIRIHAPFYMPERISYARYSEPVATPSGPAASGAVGAWKARLRERARQSPTVRRLYRQLTPLLRPERTITRSIEGNGYTYEAAEAMRCLRAGLSESPLMPLDESVQLMETMDRIRACWRDGSR